MSKINCPVCQEKIFDTIDFPGSYTICTNCMWEDDDVQYYDPDFEGGANNVSLNQAKKNYLLYKISDPSLKKSNNIF